MTRLRWWSYEFDISIRNARRAPAGNHLCMTGVLYEPTYAKLLGSCIAETNAAIRRRDKPHGSTKRQFNQGATASTTDRGFVRIFFFFVFPNTIVNMSAYNGEAELLDVGDGAAGWLTRRYHARKVYGGRASRHCIQTDAHIYLPTIVHMHVCATLVSAHIFFAELCTIAACNYLINLSKFDID